MDDRNRRIATWITYVIVSVSTVLTFVILLSNMNLTLGGKPWLDQLETLTVIAFVLGLALVLGFGLKGMLMPLLGINGIPAGAQSAEQTVRDRLARNVVVIGTIAIAVLAATLLGAIAVYSTKDLPTTGLSVFTGVLPVFATWVGTVLAFYFTNESFRQAAQNTLNLVGRSTPGAELITRPGTMIAYEKITKYEILPAQMPTGTTAERAAEAIVLTQITSLFSQTVTRVIVFDPNRHPVVIVRQKNVPAGLAATGTVADYLNAATNRQDAINFRHVSADATIEDGRRVLQLYKVSDLFVTQRGSNTEPVIGWVPDDNLK